MSSHSLLKKACTPISQPTNQRIMKQHIFAFLLAKGWGGRGGEGAFLIKNSFKKQLHRMILKALSKVALFLPGPCS